jgi:hypothetical protein
VKSKDNKEFVELPADTNTITNTSFHPALDYFILPDYSNASMVNNLFVNNIRRF